MARERFKSEEILAKLRQVEVLRGRGSTVGDAIRQIGGAARAATGSRPRRAR